MNKILEQDLDEVVDSGKELFRRFVGEKIMITGATGLVGSLVAKSFLLANERYKLGIWLVLVVRNKEKARSIFGESKDFEICDFLQKIIFKFRRTFTKIKSFEKKEVLKDIDFTFEAGKIYGLLGRNGAGKTTLFNCINGDMKTDGGRFSLEEDGTVCAPEPEDIGYVLSTPTVPEFLTGREFLKFFLDIHEKRIEDKKTTDEYFDCVSIDMEDRDKLLKDYSHGMKNKMQMLINMIARPKVLLLDEPLTSLDVVVAEEMKQLLRSLKKDCITIFSTHIMDLALDLCDEIVLLNRGVLEVVDKSDLDSREFKDKIIAALREDGNE